MRGALNGFISTEEISDEEAVRRAKEWPGLEGVDYVKEVTHKKEFAWDEKDEQSGQFGLTHGTATGNPRTVRVPLPAADIPIVAYDYGIKYNILRRLRQHGFKVQVMPATATAAEALKHKPAGIFLSNGPGDPAALGYAVDAVRDLVDAGVPIFGICLGHPDSRPGIWREDLQIEIRPSRREPARQRPRVRAGGDYFAKSRFCG